MKAPKFAVNDVLTMNKPTDPHPFTVVVKECFEYEGEYWYSVLLKDSEIVKHISRDCPERYLHRIAPEMEAIE